MKLFNLPLSFFFLLFSAICFGQSIQPDKKSLPVLDKTKSYSSKKLEFETEVTYVPLETSKDVLLGEHCKLRYVSDQKFLFSDEFKGDLFIFDMNGKVISSFNQKNGLGYMAITSVAYDEPKKEIFILDYYKKKIFVFSDNGTLLRSFKTPQDKYLAEIYNFDENTLLAFDRNRFGTDTPVKPYFYLSKDDGKEKGYVDIEVKKVNPILIEENDMGFSIQHGSIPDNCKFGNALILANGSMDTVYLLKQDKTLIPLFTQSPSVHAENSTAASVGMITDKYLTICVATYDVSEFVKISKAGQRWKTKFKYYILNRDTGDFYTDAEKGAFSVFKVDVPENLDCKLMNPFWLKNANSKGLLKGELKEITSKLDIGDNPVVQIRKIRVNR